MENRINYQRELEEIIQKNCIGEKRPSVMLHSCCGPCSSYVLEYLTQYFDVLLYFYNPNIHPEEEYAKRLKTQKQVIDSMGFGDRVRLIEGDYFTEEFFDAVRGLEDQQEGGKRCEKCIKLRMNRTAEAALQYKTDFFATTLTVSPHKNALYINSMGSLLEKEKGTAYLFSDFKKKDGYKRSIELCREYGLYRQNYCGCIFSFRDNNGEK